MLKKAPVHHSGLRLRQCPGDIAGQLLGRAGGAANSCSALSWLCDTGPAVEPLWLYRSSSGRRQSYPPHPAARRIKRELIPVPTSGKRSVTYPQSPAEPEPEVAVWKPTHLARSTTSQRQLNVTFRAGVRLSGLEPLGHVSVSSSTKREG